MAPFSINSRKLLWWWFSFGPAVFLYNFDPQLTFFATVCAANVQCHCDHHASACTCGSEELRRTPSGYLVPVEILVGGKAAGVTNGNAVQLNPSGDHSATTVLVPALATAIFSSNNKNDYGAQLLAAPSSTTSSSQTTTSATVATTPVKKTSLPSSPPPQEPSSPPAPPPPAAAPTPSPPSYGPPPFVANFLKKFGIPFGKPSGGGGDPAGEAKAEAAGNAKNSEKSSVSSASSGFAGMIPGGGGGPPAFIADKLKAFGIPVGKPDGKQASSPGSPASGIPSFESSFAGGPPSSPGGGASGGGPPPFIADKLKQFGIPVGKPDGKQLQPGGIEDDKKTAGAAASSPFAAAGGGAGGPPPFVADKLKQFGIPVGKPEGKPAGDEAATTPCPAGAPSSTSEDAHATPSSTSSGPPPFVADKLKQFGVPLGKDDKSENKKLATPAGAGTSTLPEQPKAKAQAAPPAASHEGNSASPAVGAPAPKENPTKKAASHSAGAPGPPATAAASASSPKPIVQAGTVVPLQRILVEKKAQRKSATDLLFNPATTTATTPQFRLLNLATLLAQDFRPMELLQNVADAQYIGTIEVGTPSEKVNVVFDTGSSDFWLQLDKKSSTLQQIATTPTVINYGKGSVMGYESKDRIRIAGVVIPDQEFVVVDQTQDLNNALFHGVIGLAFEGLSVNKQPEQTFLAHMLRGGVDGFCVYLTGEYSGEDSKVAFGTTIPDSWPYDRSSLAFAPVAYDAKLWWAFPGSLAVGGATFESNFVLDTGTSFIAMPRSLFVVFLMGLLGPAAFSDCALALPQQLWMCPCQTAATANTVTVEMNGQSYPISPAELFQPTGLPSPESSRATGEADTLCLLEVMPTNENMPFLLGDTFLRRVVAVFDAKNQRVGLARRASSKKAPADSAAVETGEAFKTTRETTTSETRTNEIEAGPAGSSKTQLRLIQDDHDSTPSVEVVVTGTDRRQIKAASSGASSSSDSRIVTATRQQHGQPVAQQRSAQHVQLFSFTVTAFACMAMLLSVLLLLRAGRHEDDDIAHNYFFGNNARGDGGVERPYVQMQD
ncbi:unnamed protein product [Amoebophrya sp. A120]|nr:unnamed protein product [Amoebophrya sp. A120]|eukprot:GSA120T00000602001.1